MSRYNSRNLRPNLLDAALRAKALVDQHEAPPQLSQDALACIGSLAIFFRKSWPILERATPLVWNWHIDVVCQHLQALLEDRLGKRNLLTSIPPGLAKSRIVSVVALAWMWTTRPSWRAVFASGNPRTATRDSLYCRQLVESAWYRKTFAITWTLADDSNTKLLFANSAGGSRQAITVGQKITGDRADALFIDDPLDAADANSEVARRTVLEWYDQAFANRLNDLRTGKRVLIMQRLHEEDLAGHLLRREAQAWEHIRIPMCWEESQRFTSSLGWTDPRTEDGELLFPERFPQEIVDLERQRLGGSGFAGQHQQRPASAEGEVFKRGHFGFYKPGAPLPPFSRRCQSWDTAFKQKQESDFSVGFELAKAERYIYVLDRARGRYTYPELKAIIAQWFEKSPAHAVLIEDAASGQSVIQDLKSSTALPIVPVRPDGDKVVRAHSIVPTYEADVIMLPEGAPWLNEFLDELHTFPKGAHDDQVDSFVQGIRWLAQPGGTWAFGSIPYGQ